MFCKEVLSAICLLWNVAHWHSMIDGSLNFFRGYAGKGGAWWCCIFLRRAARKWGVNFFCGGGCDLRRNYGMVVILLSLLCNYDYLILKLHQKERSYLDDVWLFIGRFIVGSVPGMTIFLVASKNKSVKIHEYDARLLIKSYSSY